MKHEQWMNEVQLRMSAKRWQHTLGVMASAEELAERYGADPDLARQAALLHDVCKQMPVDEQARIIREYELPEELLGYSKELWHGPVGAIVAMEQFGITDKLVLDAIFYHTSGRPQMTLLEKVVCLADYIEPGRDFPTVNNIREFAEHSLERALIAGFDSTISFLLQKGEMIYPLTIAARNALIQEMKGDPE